MFPLKSTLTVYTCVLGPPAPTIPIYPLAVAIITVLVYESIYWSSSHLHDIVACSRNRRASMNNICTSDA